MHFPIKHGGDLSEAMTRFGSGPEDWIDLSAGLNPEPWPVTAALATQALDRLPASADEAALVAAARAAYRLPDGAEIVAAPGTQALIQWWPLLVPAGDIGIVGPTYAEYAQSASRAGRRIVTLPGIEKIAENIRHIVLANPNNPDGRIYTPDQLMPLAQEMQRRGGWLVIDEAFADLDPAVSSAAFCATLPIVILRSFGKFFGLPGLRLGFAIAEPRIATVFRAALGPWAVSAPALAIGAQALADHRWADQARHALAAKAARLDNALAAAGFTIVGGTSLFRLVRRGDASDCHIRLAARHIWCRRFEERPNHLRFGLPRNADMPRLEEALISLATAKTNI